MRLALIILLTLGGARKEALKRWPDGQFTLKVDQTKTKYVYELQVIMKRVRRDPFQEFPRCWAELETFTGANWQEVMDKSKGLQYECWNPVNVRVNGAFPSLP